MIAYFLLVCSFADCEDVPLPDDSDSLSLLGAQAGVDRQPCLYEELSSIPQVSVCLPVGFLGNVNSSMTRLWFINDDVPPESFAQRALKAPF